MSYWQKELPRSVTMCVEKVGTLYQKEAETIFMRPTDNKDPYQIIFDSKFDTEETFQKALHHFKTALEEKTAALLLKRKEITDDYSISNSIIGDGNNQLTIFLKNSLQEAGLLDNFQLLKQKKPAFTTTRLIISPYFDSDILPNFCKEITKQLKNIPNRHTTKQWGENDFTEYLYCNLIQNFIDKVNIGDISLHNMDADIILLNIKTFALNSKIIDIRNTISDSSYLSIIKKYQNM